MINLYSRTVLLPTGRALNAGAKIRGCPQPLELHIHHRDIVSPYLLGLILSGLVNTGEITKLLK